jgi:hypothetical protein
LTAVIHVQLVLDFIGVFIALNDKQIEGGAPPRQREEQQGQEGQADAFHTLLLGSKRVRFLAVLLVAATPAPHLSFL